MKWILNWIYRRSTVCADHRAQLQKARDELDKANDELARLQPPSAEPVLKLKKDAAAEQPGPADGKKPDTGRRGTGYLGQHARNRRRAMWKPDHRQEHPRKLARYANRRPNDSHQDADHQDAIHQNQAAKIQELEERLREQMLVGPCADCAIKAKTIASLKEDKDSRGLQIQDLEKRLRQEKKRKGGYGGNDGNGKHELGPEDFKPGTTLEALNLIEMLFPDNVHVLPSARSSADKNRNFPRPNHAFDLMLRLATSYHNIVITRKGGKQQVREANIFGQNEYSEDESDTVKGNDKLASMRRFKDGEGGILEMMEHLKIGKGGKGDTWRCHFRVHKDKIYIGYCGAHLPVSGTS